MDPDQSLEDADLDSSARVEIERAENADDKTRLRVLDDLYEALEAELDEDDASRS